MNKLICKKAPDGEHRSERNEGIKPDIIDKNNKEWWNTNHLHCKFCKEPWEKLI